MLKSIKAPTLKVAEVRMELLNALRKEGTAVKQEFRKTVDTWNGPRPTFEALVGISGGSANLLVGPTGDEKGVQKWVWLEAGTRVRYAIAIGWQSKTKVGWMGSGPGAGHMLVLGKKYMLAHGIPPRPGIAPRGWTAMIQKMRKDRFREAMINALQVGRSKALARTEATQ